MEIDVVGFPAQNRDRKDLKCFSCAKGQSSGKLFPCESRDPYRVMTRWGTMAGTSSRQHRPVVMGPAFAGTTRIEDRFRKATIMQSLNPTNFPRHRRLRTTSRMIGPAPEAAPTIVMLHEGLGSAGLWGDFPDRLQAAAAGPWSRRRSRRANRRTRPCRGRGLEPVWKIAPQPGRAEPFVQHDDGRRGLGRRTDHAVFEFGGADGEEAGGALHDGSFPKAILNPRRACESRDP